MIEQTSPPLTCGSASQPWNSETPRRSKIPLSEVNSNPDTLQRRKDMSVGIYIIMYVTM